MRSYQWVVVAAFTAAMGACTHATIHVQRVLPPCSAPGVSGLCETNPNKFNPPGFRYYLPRPFVVVKAEFPVASIDRFITGKLSPDGKYLLIRPEDLQTLPEDVLRELGLVNLAGKGQPAVPAFSARSVRATSSTLQAAKGSGKGKGKDKGGTDDGGTPPADANGSGSTDQGSGSGAPPSGKDDTATAPAVASSSGGHIVLDAPYDIIYMPDYDEQYAIDFEGNSDNTSFALQLTNGWMLESIAIKTDGTAHTTGLTSVAGKAFDALSAIGVAKASATNGAGGGSANTQASGGTSLDAARDENKVAPGQDILIHIVVVDLALPGPYPIFKPTEIRSFAPSWDNVPHVAFTTPSWRDWVTFRTRRVISMTAVVNDASTPTDAVQPPQEQALAQKVGTAVAEFLKQAHYKKTCTLEAQHIQSDDGGKTVATATVKIGADCPNDIAPKLQAYLRTHGDSELSKIIVSPESRAK